MRARPPGGARTWGTSQRRRAATRSLDDDLRARRADVGHLAASALQLDQHRRLKAWLDPLDDPLGALEL